MRIPITMEPIVSVRVPVRRRTSCADRLLKGQELPWTRTIWLRGRRLDKLSFPNHAAGGYCPPQP